MWSGLILAANWFSPITTTTLEETRMKSRCGTAKRRPSERRNAKGAKPFSKRFLIWSIMCSDLSRKGWPTQAARFFLVSFRWTTLPPVTHEGLPSPRNGGEVWGEEGLWARPLCLLCRYKPPSPQPSPPPSAVLPQAPASELWLLRRTGTPSSWEREKTAVAVSAASSAARSRNIILHFSGWFPTVCAKQVRPIVAKSRPERTHKLWTGTTSMEDNKPGRWATLN